MNVKEIVRKHLEANGFDGLYSDCECARHIDDLMCDSSCIPDCEPGYLATCAEIGCDSLDHSFHIVSEKPADGDICTNTKTPGV